VLALYPGRARALVTPSLAATHRHTADYRVIPNNTCARSPTKTVYSQVRLITPSGLSGYKARVRISDRFAAARRTTRSSALGRLRQSGNRPRMTKYSLKQALVGRRPVCSVSSRSRAGAQFTVLAPMPSLSQVRLLTDERPKSEITGISSWAFYPPRTTCCLDPHDIDPTALSQEGARVQPRPMVGNFRTASSKLDMPSTSRPTRFNRRVP